VCANSPSLGKRRKIGDRPRTTDPGIVKGKVAYLAPELLENAKPDPRCDLYSLGVVLWEALAAQRLFGNERNDIETALKILQSNIPTITELRPELPPELAAIVATATARNPRHRFARATEMIDALAGLLMSLGESAENAATLGKAIIASDIPAHREQDPGEGCLFFEPAGTEDLARKLLLLWKNTDGGVSPEREQEAKRTTSERRRLYGAGFASIVEELGAAGWPAGPGR